jgi:hypothetical protein
MVSIFLVETLSERDSFLYQPDLDLSIEMNIQ